jgi:hypothetical protein
MPNFENTIAGGMQCRVELDWMWPGTLHPVIVRGIERRRIVNDVWRDPGEGYDFFEKDGHNRPNVEVLKKCYVF